MIVLLFVWLLILLGGAHAQPQTPAPGAIFLDDFSSANITWQGFGAGFPNAAPGFGSISLGGHTWTVTTGFVVQEDGVNAGTTSSIANIYNVNGTIWAVTYSQGWSSWNGTTWVAGTRPVPFSWIDHYPFGGNEYNLPFVDEQEYLNSISGGQVSSTAYQPFSVANSVLSIKAQSVASSGVSNPGSQPWNSGGISSAGENLGTPVAGLFAFQYGYVECSCQVPTGGPTNLSSPGFWSQFVLYPSSGMGPAEIDIFEVLGGSSNQVRQTIHSTSGATFFTSTAAIDTGFHRVGVDWQSDFITFYIDGQRTGQIATPSDLKQPMYMVASLAVAGSSSWSGTPLNTNLVDPGTMQIGYLGVWRNFAATQTPIAGSALPSGYEFASGNQIQDGVGNNLRWACTQRRSGPPDQAGMNAIRAAGFNCIRIPYRDAFLSGASTPSGASCDAGMTSMVTCVSEATNAGLKVILEHLGNEAPTGVNNACVGQQKNGLWYDLNSAAPYDITQNQDGCGDTGTITYAAFKQNWVNLAGQFGGNSTVVGMDLHNEPLTYGTSVSAQVNWGGSGGSGSGQFVANAGKITDPNGAAWAGRGFNVTTEDVQAGNVPLSTIQRLFPRTNYVRVSNFLGGGYTDGDDPTNSTISAWVTSLTNAGIRVEFSDYAGNSPACRTGSDLINASNWYKKIATFYTSNPFVGYESQNECFDNSNGPFTWAAQVTSNYNAVRGGWFPGITVPNAGYVVTNGGNTYTAQAACTGNTSGTGPGGTGSGIVDGSCRWNFASSNPAPSGGAPKSMFLIGSPGGNFTSGGTYLNSQLPLSTMTNVAWDIHPYAGSSCCGYVGAGIAATQTAYDTFLSNSITAWQGFTTTSEGAIPVIAGEFGNGTNGSDVDATGQLATQAGADELSTTGGLAGVGYWLWFCGCNPAGVADQITTGGSNPSINTVNSYGPSVQTIIANAPGTGPTPGNGGGGGTSPACTVASAANSCTLSQTQVNAVMSAINTEQQAEVPGGECFSGTCFPQNALVGDTIITTAGGQQLTGNVPVSLTDSANNTWTLQAGLACQGNAPNWWYGGMALNGVPQWCGYNIAIRKLASGHVWVEEAKQAGWWDLTAVQAGATKVYVSDPGPGPNNVTATTVSGADLQAMCNDVGGAIHSANSGVIIICEGAQTNTTLFSGAANGASIIGDLSTVGTKPVTGVPANKLVYSVHDFPTNVSTATPDNGAAADRARSAAWGYLETQNLAPVWVGAIGCSCDNTNGALADDQAWAGDLVAYLNGGAGANGGPSFAAPKQPMGMSWYSWTQTGATTIVTPGNGTIGAGGHTWAVTAGGQITVDGATDTTTANVTQLADVSGTIWQNTSTAGWFTEPDTSTATSHLWVSQGFATPSWLAAQNPDGTLNADGSLKSGQQAFWSQLLFGPSVAPPVTTTWNPSDTSGMTLSTNNTVATATTTNPASVRSTTSKTAGKECFEITATAISGNWDVGLANGTFSLTAPNGLGGDANGVGFDPNSTGGLQGVFLNNVLLSSGGVSSANGDKATICEDFGAQLFWVTTSAMRGAGNTWNNSPTANPATATGGLSTAGLTCPCFIVFNEFEAGTATINPAGPFAVTTPTGFSPWDTAIATTASPIVIILGANDNHPQPANDNERPANWSWNIP